MLMGNPKHINIVQLGGIHKLGIIDNESPKSVDLVEEQAGSSAWVDKQTFIIIDNGVVRDAPEEEVGRFLLPTCWETTLTKIRPSDDKFDDIELTEKNKNFMKNYKKRNYIAQHKWELQVAIAMISNHAKATNIDVRIIPYKKKDHNYSSFEYKTRTQIDQISRLYDHNRLFWYQNRGAREWKESEVDTIVQDNLIPWLKNPI